jgi:hypothetical protein
VRRFSVNLILLIQQFYKKLAAASQKKLKAQIAEKHN